MLTTLSGWANDLVAWLSPAWAWCRDILLPVLIAAAIVYGVLFAVIRFGAAMQERKERRQSLAERQMKLQRSQQTLDEARAKLGIG